MGPPAADGISGERPTCACNCMFAHFMCLQFPVSGLSGCRTVCAPRGSFDPCTCICVKYWFPHPCCLSTALPALQYWSLCTTTLLSLDKGFSPGPALPSTLLSLPCVWPRLSKSWVFGQPFPCTVALWGTEFSHLFLWKKALHTKRASHTSARITHSLHIHWSCSSSVDCCIWGQNPPATLIGQHAYRYVGVA